MSDDPVLFSVEDSYALLTLNRPDRLNAFTKELHAGLREALDRAEAAAVRAILITGAGRGFCAGQDLRERGTPDPDNPPDLRVFLRERYNPLIERMRALPVPIVAAVNGVAAGAGMGFALAADIVIAGQSAQFIQSFSKLGLVPDSGSSYFLPRLVGPARARALTMLATPVAAAQAAAWGMIWSCVDDADLMTEAKALTKQLASAPTRGLGLTKKLLDASADHSLTEQLALERDLQYQAGQSPDYIEGVLAFQQKRKPTFSGR